MDKAVTDFEVMKEGLPKLLERPTLYNVRSFSTTRSPTYLASTPRLVRMDLVYR